MQPSLSEVRGGALLLPRLHGGMIVNHPADVGDARALRYGLARAICIVEESVVEGVEHHVRVIDLVRVDVRYTRW